MKKITAILIITAFLFILPRPAYALSAPTADWSIPKYLGFILRWDWDTQLGTPDRFKIDCSGCPASSYVMSSGFGTIPPQIKSLPVSYPIDVKPDSKQITVVVTALDKAGKIMAKYPSASFVNKVYIAPIKPTIKYSNGKVYVTWPKGPAWVEKYHLRVSYVDCTNCGPIINVDKTINAPSFSATVPSNTLRIIVLVDCLGDGSREHYTLPSANFTIPKTQSASSSKQASKSTSSKLVASSSSSASAKSSTSSSNSSTTSSIVSSQDLGRVLNETATAQESNQLFLALPVLATTVFVATIVILGFVFWLKRIN